MKKTLPHLMSLVLMVALVACTNEDPDQCYQMMRIGPANSDVQFTAPDGETYFARTNENGEIRVPCEVEQTPDDDPLKGMFIII